MSSQLDSMAERRIQQAVTQGEKESKESLQKL